MSDHNHLGALFKSLMPNPVDDWVEESPGRWVSKKARAVVTKMANSGEWGVFGAGCEHVVRGDYWLSYTDPDLNVAKNMAGFMSEYNRLVAEANEKMHMDKLKYGGEP